MNNKIAILEISSWIGISIGAQHFYASLCYYDQKNQYQKMDLTRKLSAKEIKELNKADSYLGLYHKIGEDYKSFNTSEQTRIVAIKYVIKFLHSIEILLEGRSAVASVQKCIYAKDNKTKIKINKLYDRANKLNFYHKKENWKKMEKIDNKFLEITKIY
jgi:hypothetical protein